MKTDNVLAQVAQERNRQEKKWGEQNHPWSHRNAPAPLDRWFDGQLMDQVSAKGLVDAFAGDGSLGYSDILMEEVVEALDEEDPRRVRAELIQVAAVAVAAVESIDRNGTTWF